MPISDLNLDAVRVGARRAEAFAAEHANGREYLPEAVLDFFNRDLPAVLAELAAARDQLKRYVLDPDWHGDALAMRVDGGSVRFRRYADRVSLLATGNTLGAGVTVSVDQAEELATNLLAAAEAARREQAVGPAPATCERCPACGQEDVDGVRWQSMVGQCIADRCPERDVTDASPRPATEV